MMSLGIADANKLMSALALGQLSTKENTTTQGHSIMTTKGVHRLIADTYGVGDDNVAFYGWNYVNKDGADIDHLWVMTQTIKSVENDRTLRKLFFVGWWNRKTPKYPEGQWGATNKVLVALPDNTLDQYPFMEDIVDFHNLEKFLSEATDENPHLIVVQGSLPSQPPKLWRSKEWKEKSHLSLKKMPDRLVVNGATISLRSPNLRFYTVAMESTWPQFSLLNWKVEQVKGLLNL